jgi:uncharacterized protein YcfJ
MLSVLLVLCFVIRVALALHCSRCECKDVAVKKRAAVNDEEACSSQLPSNDSPVSGLMEW